MCHGNDLSTTTYNNWQGNKDFVTFPTHTIFFGKQFLISLAKTEIEKVEKITKCLII